MASVFFAKDTMFFNGDLSLCGINRIDMPEIIMSSIIILIGEVKYPVKNAESGESKATTT
ncbi:hypothetical protein NUBL21991_40720 [Klebsiella pneumoniae]|nr:hypothetical protein NUBL21991_40720 [Klebsiella pneumoniae]